MYEIAFILRSQLESNLDESLSKIEKELAEFGGNVKSKDSWGKKRLAYKIDKNIDGFYYIWQVEMPSSKVSEIKKYFETNQDVIRTLVIKL